MQKVTEEPSRSSPTFPLISSGRFNSGRAITLLDRFGRMRDGGEIGPARFAVINVAVVTGGKETPAMIAFEVSPEPPRK